MILLVWTIIVLHCPRSSQSGSGTDGETVASEPFENDRIEFFAAPDASSESSTLSTRTLSAKGETSSLHAATSAQALFQHALDQFGAARQAVETARLQVDSTRARLQRLEQEARRRQQNGTARPVQFAIAMSSRCVVELISFHWRALPQVPPTMRFRSSRRLSLLLNLSSS